MSVKTYSSNGCVHECPMEQWADDPMASVDAMPLAGNTVTAVYSHSDLEMGNLERVIIVFGNCIWHSWA